MARPSLRLQLVGAEYRFLNGRPTERPNRSLTDQNWVCFEIPDVLVRLSKSHSRPAAVFIDEPSILGTLFACNVRVTTGIGIAVLIFN